MKILHLIQTLFKNGKEAFFGLGKKQKIAVIVGFLLISAGVIYFLFQRQNTPEVTYQTSKVSKGTLVTSISGTGSISSGNSTSITTAATGTVSKIYVSNGDQVKKGDKIAEITLDEYATKQRAEAWAKYAEAARPETGAPLFLFPKEIGEICETFCFLLFFRESLSSSASRGFFCLGN